MVSSQLFCTNCGAANQTNDAFCFACGHPLHATPASPYYPTVGLATGNTTGLLAPNLLLKQRYRILEPIGKGGFAAVYKAEDVQLGNRLLAVKEMSQNALNSQEIAEASENFKREAHILAALKHPNLPSIYEQFSEAGRWYLVMDFIEGVTLEEYSQKQPEGHLSVEETLELGLQLCTVLSYLHTRQPPIIFRDLKPENIMLTPEGNLYLIDFGIARHFKPGRTSDTIALGSPGYAAPEQYGKAQTTARSDIYSLGATLHHLLTGVDPSYAPFHFAPLQLHGQHTPPDLRQLLVQMTDMSESNRPTSMIAVKQELQGILTQQRVGQGKFPLRGTQSNAPIVQPLQQVQNTPPGAHQQMSTPKAEGIRYLIEKRYQEALAAFEKTIQLDPTDVEVYYGKSLALDNLKRYQEALAVIEQAIRFSPNYAPAFNLKGDVLEKLGRYEEALTALDQAIQLDPKKRTAFISKGVILNNLGRYEEGLIAHNKAIELDPKNSYAYNNKAVALSALGRHTEAMIACEQAIQLDPKNSAIINCKGKVLSGLGRKVEALAAYNEAIKLDPRYSLAYFNKGGVLAELRRYKEALAAYDEAIKVDPRNSEVYANKGSLLCVLGHYKVAQVCFQQAMAFNPSEQVVRLVQQVKKRYKLS